MSQTDTQRQALYSRLYSIEADISRASSAISEARNNVASLDSTTGSLQSRLKSIRGRDYAAIGHLESGVEQLNRRWMEVAPAVKQALASSVEPIAPHVNSLQAEARGLRTQIDTGNMAYLQMSLERLSTAASSMRSRVSSEVDKVNSPIMDLFSSAQAIDENLEIAENTVGLFGQANFPLKEEESPVLAFEGKLLKGDKSEGTLYFTNQRFIFEAKKEVVLEKKLFFVTKKKTERLVVINQPIGAIQEITKGRVGFLAWTGIFVKFKSSTGQEETQFDVEGREADIITSFFDYIIKGEADRDIAKFKGTTTTAAPTKKLLECPRCFAPYTREVYKGQKAVQCEYCGTQIVIQ